MRLLQAVGSIVPQSHSAQSAAYSVWLVFGIIAIIFVVACIFTPGDMLRRFRDDRGARRAARKFHKKN